MKFNPLHFQPLALPGASRAIPDPACVLDVLRRLEPLTLEVAGDNRENVTGYALKYIERYEDDVLQLEMAWEALYAALSYAWESKDYRAVVFLVAGMARPAGRICSIAEAQHLLHMGIEASRHTGDNEHCVMFLNRLGGLLFASARYWFGRQIWSASLQMASPSASIFGLWQPLISFAHIADILGSYSYAQQFVEAVINRRHVDDPESLIVAIFIRGFYGRLMRDLDSAREDFRCCLQLLTSSLPAQDATPERRLFMLVVQTELARAEGSYERSRACAEAAIGLAQVYSDRYTVAALLFDYGLYAYTQDRLNDIPSIYLRLRDVAHQMNVPHLHHCCQFLSQFAIEQTQPTRLVLTTHHEPVVLSPETTSCYEALTEREREVLCYAAAGCSNREIAAHLVIERATVKKHLEHIFLKLDVHNRTSAIARARTLNLIS